MNKRIRKKKGIYSKFKDRELWNLDLTIAKFVLPRLIKYKKDGMGYPGRLVIDDGKTLDSVPGDGERKYTAQWDEILDKMIWSFGQIITESEEPKFPEDAVQNIEAKDGVWHSHIDEEVKKKYWNDMQAYNERIQEGLHLFAEYFRNLWW